MPHSRTAWNESGRAHVCRFYTTSATACDFRQHPSHDVSRVPAYRAVTHVGCAHTPSPRLSVPVLVQSPQQASQGPKVRRGAAATICWLASLRRFVAAWPGSGRKVSTSSQSPTASACFAGTRCAHQKSASTCVDVNAGADTQLTSARRLKQSWSLVRSGPRV